MKTALFVAIVVALALVFGFAAHNYVAKYYPSTPTASPSPSVVATVQYKEYGNGVYYFEATGDEYMQMLALFYEQNPGLRCTMQGFTETKRTPGCNWSDTNVTGFILRCYDPAIPAQDVTVP